MASSGRPHWLVTALILMATVIVAREVDSPWWIALVMVASIVVLGLTSGRPMRRPLTLRGVLLMAAYVIAVAWIVWLLRPGG